MKASNSKSEVKTWVPTGFNALDKVLGGGVPVGKITEVSGKFSVGKSTLALSVIAQAQKMKLKTCYVDTEMSFSVPYATFLGVDCDELDIIQKRLGEDVLDETEEWITTHTKGFIVFDSVGSILTRAEVEKKSGDVTIGAQARLFAPFLKKINTLLVENQIAFFVCNHEGINIMTNAITTPGGKAMEYFADIWIRLKKGNKKAVRNGVQIGKSIEALIWKNKIYPSETKEVELMMIFGEGFSAENDLVTEAADRGIITKTGQYWYFEGQRIARGDAALREAIKQDELAKKIKMAIKELTEQV